MEQTSSDQTLQQLMFSLIEIWKSSGKTQQDFCKEKDIAYHKFHYWFRKYNQQDQAVKTPATFTRIKVKEQIAVSSGLLEVAYPDGRRVIFNQAVDVDFLRSLLA